MSLNKFIIVGLVQGSPLRQETNTGEKVKIKVEASIDIIHKHTIHITCYDKTAQYCLDNLVDDDMVYVEGYIKPIKNLNNQPDNQIIAKFVKRITYKRNKSNSGNRRKIFSDPSLIHMAKSLGN